MDTPRHHHPSSVLLVDDHAPVRRLLRLALEQAGLQVIEASSHFEAQHCVRHALPDAVVLNLQRAEPDGLDLLKWLRGTRDLDQVPIAFLAGHRREGLRWRAVRAGADWFALRPLSVVLLQQRVARLIRQGRPPLKAVAGRDAA